MKVLEIFHSIEGEGVRAGELATFVRFAGCNLACRYCDTVYSIRPKLEDVKEMSVDEIVNAVECKNVTLTGGEPLLQTEIEELVTKLIQDDKFVNIETNGTIMPFEVPPLTGSQVIFTVDYKCGASGHEDKMRPEVFRALRPYDVIKCVVGSVEDLENALANLQRWVPFLGESIDPYVYFSPVFGKIEPKQIVEFMKQNKLNGKYRVQLQLHKFIWEPNARMV